MFWDICMLWNVRENAFKSLSICSFFMEKTHSLSIGTRAYFSSLRTKFLRRAYWKRDGGWFVLFVLLVLLLLGYAEVVCIMDEGHRRAERKREQVRTRSPWSHTPKTKFLQEGPTFWSSTQLWTWFTVHSLVAAPLSGDQAVTTGTWGCLLPTP